MSAHDILNARPAPTMVNGRLMLPLSYVEILEEQLRQKMRDDAEHKGYMATVGELWKNLPENLAHMPYAKSADNLRKHALIKTGWCDVQTILFESEIHAMQQAKAISYMARMGFGYAIVKVSGPAVICMTPHSQSYKEMGREDFKQSKADVLDYLRGIVGVSAKDLERAVR